MFRTPAQNFLGVGEGGKPLACCAHAPACLRGLPGADVGSSPHWPPDSRRISAISRAVLALWQRSQRLCRFARSVNNAQSPRWGLTWSTLVARVRRPALAHSRQKGSRRSWVGRRSFFQMGRPYQPCHWAEERLGAFAGLWAGQ